MREWALQAPFVGQVGHPAIQQPPFSRWATFPRLANAGGRLIVAWGEPADTANLEPSYFGHDPTVILYSSYSSADGWSPPVELIRDTSGISWSHTFGALRETSSGDVHLAFSSRAHRPTRLHYAAILADGSVRVSTFPLLQASAYAAVAARDDDVVLAVPAVADSTNWDVRVHLYRSGDGGRTWSEPVGVAPTREFPPRTVNLEFGADGSLYLMVGEGETATSPWTAAFRILRSLDEGRSWTADHRIPVAAGVQSPQLLSDGCGHLHVTFSDFAGGRSGLIHVLRANGDWGSSVSPFPDAGYYALMHNPGELHLLFQHQPRDGEARLTLVQSTYCA